LKGIERLTGPFLNDPGYEVPEDKILVVPHAVDQDGNYKEIIFPLKGETKRDWFTSHFYYCLPLTIGNQYGFAIKSTRTFEVFWPGGENPAMISYQDNVSVPTQAVSNHFNSGIITFQNYFALKTPIGVNLMTIQPPNFYIPGIVSMTGVVETDQIRRDFTFNLKVTIPNYKITINKGDVVAAFLPIPRRYVDKFDVALVTDVFDRSVHLNESQEANRLGQERATVDKKRPHESGRRYFNGTHTDDSPYQDHQKRMIGE
jgi:hypothetical protein